MNFDIASYSLGIITPFAIATAVWLVGAIAHIVRVHPWVIEWGDRDVAPWIQIARSKKKYFGGRWSLPFGIAIRIPWGETKNLSFYIGRYY